MAMEQKHLWLAAVGVIVVVAVAGFGDFRAVIGVKHDVAALNDKVDATSGALDGIKTAIEALTKIQKSSSLGDVKSEIDAVKANIESANAALNAIQKNGALGDIKTQIASLDAKVDQIDGAIAKMQKASAMQASDMERERAHGDALTKMQADVADLKTHVNSASASLGKVADAVARLNVAPAPQASTPASTKPKTDLVVVYVSVPEATGTTGSVPAAAAMAPLTVYYERVGSIDDNGEAALVARKVQAIVKSRKGCAIAVAGHTDTLGDPENNVELSRERANEVAMKLKAALAGKDIPISQTAWGERKLQVWTPDQTTKKANRRVDIIVTCKG